MLTLIMTSTYGRLKRVFGDVVKAKLGQERRRETEFFFMNFDPEEVERPYINFRLDAPYDNRCMDVETLPL